MLGETVRATRVKRGFTQAHLADLADVSRRHLAALEKEANVSINVLRKVASVLDLVEIDLGELTVQTPRSASSPVNMPLLADTIREAHADAFRAQSLLAAAETILDHGDGQKRSSGLVAHFPKMPAQVLDLRRRRRSGGAVADKGGPAGIPIAGEIRQGEAVVVELSGETAPLPPSIVEKGEVVFRARGDKMRDQGIEDGDLLVVELRQTGRASTGELVIGKVGDLLYVGRWWQKHGQKAIMTDGPSEITTGGTSKRALKVLAAINAIVRPK